MHAGEGIAYLCVPGLEDTDRNCYSDSPLPCPSGTQEKPGNIVQPSGLPVTCPLLVFPQGSVMFKMQHKQVKGSQLQQEGFGLGSRKDLQSSLMAGVAGLNGTSFALFSDTDVWLWLRGSGGAQSGHPRWLPHHQLGFWLRGHPCHLGGRPSVW